MNLTQHVDEEAQVSKEVAELAYRKLHLALLERGWPDPDAPQSLAIRAATLRYDMAINAAILSTYGVSEEFELVVELLYPDEIARFLWESARARKPNYVYESRVG